MAFFDELTKGIKATSQTVAQKTKEIGETVQIKSQMNTEKETIARLYESIGKQVFELANEEAEEKFASEFASIRSAMNKIAELKSVLADMDGCVICPKCGEKIDKASRFCMKCGAPVEVRETTEIIEAEVIVPSENDTEIETAVPAEECAEAETAAPEEIVAEAEAVETKDESDETEA